MAKVHMQGNVDIDEFRRRLKEAMKQSTPISDLCELAEELFIYEHKYGVKSPIFYDKFMRGEMGDDMDFIGWAGAYKRFNRLKEHIERRLEKCR